MRPLLVVTHPRRIPECVDAFRVLTCDVAYISGMHMPAVCRSMAAIVDEGGYDAYLVCADDCVVTQAAVNAVVDVLEDGHPAATGWCRLDRGHGLVNLTRGPLTGDHPVEEAYDFYPYREVADHPREIVPTGFMGMALTGMAAAMWRTFPLSCFEDHEGRGWSSDFRLSTQLRDARVEMVAARGGYVDHVKERWMMADRAPSARLLIGDIPQEVIWQCA